MFFSEETGPMAQEFEREVVVYIWRFGGMMNPMHTGHVAVKLKAPEFDRSTTGGKSSVYMSWWPVELGADDSTLDGMKLRHAAPKSSYTMDRVAAVAPKVRKNLAAGTFQPQGQQKYVGPTDPVTNLPTSPTGPQNWGASADIKIRLPGTGEGGRVFGLDMVAMHRWWCVFSKSGPGMFSILNLRGMNCSKAAYMILRAGGAARFAKLPIHGLLNPNVIERWATTVREKIDAKNRVAQGFEMLMSRKEHHGSSVNLLVLENWKKESNKNVTVFATRVGQVKKIDGLLAEYAPHLNDESSKGLEVRAGLLDQILGLVQSYLSEKATNKRADAIIDLGDQALKMLISINAKRLELLKNQKAGNISQKEKFEIGDQINAINHTQTKLEYDDTWSY